MISQKWSLNQSLKDELKRLAEAQEEWAEETAWTKRLEDVTVGSMFRNIGISLEAQCGCVRDGRGRKWG